MKAEDIKLEVDLLDRATGIVRQIGEIAREFPQEVVGYLFVCGSRGSFEVKVSLTYAHTDGSKAVVRRFVSALLAEFHAKAMRSAESPEKLSLDMRDGLRLEIDNYPTSVKYSCEKKCIAILPDGRKVPMNEVPIEA